jgi:hypothetical protein
MQGLIRRFAVISTALAVSSAPLPVGADSTPGSSPAPVPIQQLHGRDLVNAVRSGRLSLATSSAPNSGFSCPAELSTTGNVQVNCRAEDGSAQFPPSFQNETTISAYGSKVVVGFNDDLVPNCCGVLNLSGYSVSTNRGRTFTDMGDVPWLTGFHPLGDPSVTHDELGNFYYATLAFTQTDSLIGVYKMAAGSNDFHMMSMPVDLHGVQFLADKDLLEVATDAEGHVHFYITWNRYNFDASLVYGPVMLTDSTDGMHWRTMQVSRGPVCEPMTPGSHPVPAGRTLYVSWIEQDTPSCTSDPHATLGHQVMATVDVGSGHVKAITTVARTHGGGDRLADDCGPVPFEVIATSTTQYVRNPDIASSTIDGAGTLYEIWNDRPAGPGGGNENATRIYLTYSRDHNLTWSSPQVISGATSPNFMNDRFQPWLIADEDGLHAMWYERVANPENGADLVRTDKADLTLATDHQGPMLVRGGESKLSTVAFPVPRADAFGCYMGDYNQIASNGHTRFVSWGDNRNTIATPDGPVIDPDVFMQAY